MIILLTIDPALEAEKPLLHSTRTGLQRMTVMTLEEKLARLRSHHNNVRRYRRLLETHLSDLEREYVEGRIFAERAALQALAPDMS